MKTASFARLLESQPRKRRNETFSAYYGRLRQWAAPIQDALIAKIQSLQSELQHLNVDALTYLPTAAKNLADRRRIEAVQTADSELRALDALLYSWYATVPRADRQQQIDAAAVDAVCANGKVNPHIAMEQAFHALGDGLSLPAPVANWLKRGFAAYLAQGAERRTLDECLGLTAKQGMDTPTEAVAKSRISHERASWMSLLIAHGASVQAAAELVLEREKLLRKHFSAAYSGQPKVPKIETLTRAWGADWKRRYPHQSSDFVNVAKLRIFSESDVFVPVEKLPELGDIANTFGWPKDALKIARSKGLKL